MRIAYDSPEYWWFISDIVKRNLRSPSGGFSNCRTLLDREFTREVVDRDVAAFNPGRCWRSLMLSTSHRRGRPVIQRVFALVGPENTWGTRIYWNQGGQILVRGPHDKWETFYDLDLTDAIVRHQRWVVPKSDRVA